METVRLILANRDLAGLLALVSGTIGACVVALVVHPLIGRSRSGAFFARWFTLVVYAGGLAGLFYARTDGWVDAARTGSAYRLRPATLFGMVFLVSLLLALLFGRAATAAAPATSTEPDE